MLGARRRAGARAPGTHAPPRPAPDRCARRARRDPRSAGPRTGSGRVAMVRRMKKLLLLLALIGLAGLAAKQLSVVVTGAPALLCTDWFAEHYADRLRAASPGDRARPARRRRPGPRARPRPGGRVLLLRRLVPGPQPGAADGRPRRAQPALAAHVLGRHRPPDLRSVPRSWRAHHDVVGRQRATHRPHRHAVPARPQPRHPRPAARPGRPTPGTRSRSTTSTARRSASSAWARSPARSSAWRPPSGCGRSACAAPCSATSRARRGRSTGCPSSPRRSTCWPSPCP